MYGTKRAIDHSPPPSLSKSTAHGDSFDPLLEALQLQPAPSAARAANAAAAANASPPLPMGEGRIDATSGHMLDPGGQQLASGPVRLSRSVPFESKDQKRQRSQANTNGPEDERDPRFMMSQQQRQARKQPTKKAAQPLQAIPQLLAVARDRTHSNSWSNVKDWSGVLAHAARLKVQAAEAAAMGGTGEQHEQEAAAAAVTNNSTTVEAGHEAGRALAHVAEQAIMQLQQQDPGVLPLAALDELAQAFVALGHTSSNAMLALLWSSLAKCLGHRSSKVDSAMHAMVQLSTAAAEQGGPQGLDDAVVTAQYNAVTAAVDVCLRGRHPKADILSPLLRLAPQRRAPAAMSPHHALVDIHGSYQASCSTKLQLALQVLRAVLPHTRACSAPGSAAAAGGPPASSAPAGLAAVPSRTLLQVVAHCKALRAHVAAELAARADLRMECSNAHPSFLQAALSGLQAVHAPQHAQAQVLQALADALHRDPVASATMCSSLLQSVVACMTPGTGTGSWLYMLGFRHLLQQPAAALAAQMVTLAGGARTRSGITEELLRTELAEVNTGLPPLAATRHLLALLAALRVLSPRMQAGDAWQVPDWHAALQRLAAGSDFDAVSPPSGGSGPLLPAPMPAPGTQDEHHPELWRLTALQPAPAAVQSPGLAVSASAHQPQPAAAAPEHAQPRLDDALCLAALVGALPSQLLPAVPVALAARFLAACDELCGAASPAQLLALAGYLPSLRAWLLLTQPPSVVQAQLGSLAAAARAMAKDAKEAVGDEALVAAVRQAVAGPEAAAAAAKADGPAGVRQQAALLRVLAASAVQSLEPLSREVHGAGAAVRQLCGLVQACQEQGRLVDAQALVAGHMLRMGVPWSVEVLLGIGRLAAPQQTHRMGQGRQRVAGQHDGAAALDASSDASPSHAGVVSPAAAGDSGSDTALDSEAFAEPPTADGADPNPGGSGGADAASKRRQQQAQGPGSGSEAPLQALEQLWQAAASSEVEGLESGADAAPLELQQDLLPLGTTQEQAHAHGADAHRLGIPQSLVGEHPPPHWPEEQRQRAAGLTETELRLAQGLQPQALRELCNTLQRHASPHPGAMLGELLLRCTGVALQLPSGELLEALHRLGPGLPPELLRPFSTAAASPHPPQRLLFERVGMLACFWWRQWQQGGGGAAAGAAATGGEGDAARQQRSLLWERYDSLVKMATLYRRLHYSHRDVLLALAQATQHVLHRELPAWSSSAAATPGPAVPGDKAEPHDEVLAQLVTQLLPRALAELAHTCPSVCSGVLEEGAVPLLQALSRGLLAAMAPPQQAAMVVVLELSGTHLLPPAGPRDSVPAAGQQGPWATGIAGSARAAQAPGANSSAGEAALSGALQRLSAEVGKQLAGQLHHRGPSWQPLMRVLASSAPLTQAQQALSGDLPPAPATTGQVPFADGGLFAAMCDAAPLALAEGVIDDGAALRLLWLQDRWPGHAGSSVADALLTQLSSKAAAGTLGPGHLAALTRAHLQRGTSQQRHDTATGCVPVPVPAAAYAVAAQLQRLLMQASSSGSAAGSAVIPSSQLLVMMDALPDTLILRSGSTEAVAHAPGAAVMATSTHDQQQQQEAAAEAAGLLALFGASHSAVGDGLPIQQQAHYARSRVATAIASSVCVALPAMALHPDPAQRTAAAALATRALRLDCIDGPVRARLQAAAVAGTLAAAHGGGDVQVLGGWLVLCSEGLVGRDSLPLVGLLAARAQALMGAESARLGGRHDAWDWQDGGEGLLGEDEDEDNDSGGFHYRGVDDASSLGMR